MEKPMWTHCRPQSDNAERSDLAKRFFITCLVNGREKELIVPVRLGMI
jgi:hypothetical protein